ncbi:hypothetical protein Salat_0176800 [Sesamum alatum]|uniref:Uncharacterized protein n=1 Tax=Sesamum alatum TaxID=300844 RepID=A0AAE2CXW2_9LAMI|nr:hypothetical protein Salat_0176800 [Sesamum alatum]
MTFPALVPTPRMEPQAGVFNMNHNVPCADVDILSTRSMQVLGQFPLAQAYTTAATATAMVEKYEALVCYLEQVYLKLKETRTKTLNIHRRLQEGEAQAREIEVKLRVELNLLKSQMDEREKQMVILSIENEVLKSTTVQAYDRGGEEGISFGQSSGATLYKNSQEFTEESRTGSPSRGLYGRDSSPSILLPPLSIHVGCDASFSCSPADLHDPSSRPPS